MHSPKKRSVFYLLAVIGVIYALALIFGWFDSYEYFDAFMHVLGGVWTGFLFLVLFTDFFSSEAYTHPAERTKIIIFGISFASLIGVLWEFFEFLLNTFFDVYLQPSIGDTMGDLLLDMVGALGVYIWFFFLKKRFTRKSKEGISSETIGE